jgi:hypothetical protein
MRPVWVMRPGQLAQSGTHKTSKEGCLRNWEDEACLEGVDLRPGSGR